MLPSGYPGVVRDGVAALNWAGAVLERALQRIPEWVAELARADAKSLADAKERAESEGVLAVSFPDPSDWNGSFTEAHAEVTELARRLERRTRVEWQSGDAAQYFSGLELRIIESWAHGAHEPLVTWLGEKPEEIRRRRLEFEALGKWLHDYLDAHA